MKKRIFLSLILAGMLSNSVLLCMEEGNKGFQEKKEISNKIPSLKELSLNAIKEKKELYCLEDLLEVLKDYEIDQKTEQNFILIVAENIIENQKKITNEDGRKDYCKKFDFLEKKLQNYEIAYQKMLDKIKLTNFEEKLDGKVLFSPDGKLVFQLTTGQMSLYAIKNSTLEKLQTINYKNNNDYSRIIFSADNQSFALLPLMNKNVEVYRLDQDKKGCHFVGNFDAKSAIYSIIFNPEATHLFFFIQNENKNNFICVYDLKNNITTTHNISNDSDDLVYSFNNNKLRCIGNDKLVSGFDRKISIYRVDFKDGKCNLKLEDGATNLSNEAYTINALEIKGNQLFYTLSDGTFGIYNLTTKKIMHSQKLGGNESIKSIYFGPNETLILEDYFDLYIYELKEGTLTEIKHIHSPTMFRKVLVNSQKTLLLYCNQDEFKVFDLKNPKKIIQIFNYEYEDFFKLAYSATNQIFISSYDGEKKKSNLFLCDLNPYLNFDYHLSIEEVLTLLSEYNKNKEFESHENKNEQQINQVKEDEQDSICRIIYSICCRII